MSFNATSIGTIERLHPRIVVAGVVCTGTLIAATRDDNCQVPVSKGEDYSGPQCTPETSNQTTIVLDLKFLYTVPEPLVGMVSGDSKTR
jgi:hypothetical protein